MATKGKAGVDLMRGRPTPSIGTTEAKLQQRKLDALTRGVHRIKDVESLPYGIHLIGVGGAGARVVEQVLRDGDASKLTSPDTGLWLPVPNPSETVRQYTGTPSVSEAAALLVAASVARQALPMTALLVEKHKHRGADGRNATVSLARCDSFLFSQP